MTHGVVPHAMSGLTKPAPTLIVRFAAADLKRHMKHTFCRIKDATVPASFGGVRITNTKQTGCKDIKSAEKLWKEIILYVKKGNVPGKGDFLPWL